MDCLKVLAFLVLVHTPSLACGDYCSQPPLNHIFSQSQEDFYCPAYRNLARHVPLEDGLCPTSSIYRKYKNCLSDRDCAKESYCCFSICNGITRCYNPYLNEWTEAVADGSPKPPFPLIKIPPTQAPTTPPTQAGGAAAPTTTAAPTKGPAEGEDVYDQLTKSQNGDDDAKFVAEEGV